MADMTGRSMTSRHVRARAMRFDARPWFGWAALALLGLMMAAGAAWGQTGVPPEKVAPKQKVTSPAVIRPAPHVDPAMRVTPPAGQKFPTPVIKPQARHGNRVVVPK